MKRTALHLVPALLACLLLAAGAAEATNQRKVAFGLQGPFDCTLCHGNETTGQYWPDGTNGIPSYADDSPGSAASHNGHVLAIGQYLGYGNYSTTMYDDTQQKAICAYCHFAPGGGGHLNDTAGSPANQVDVIGDGVSAGTFTAFDVAAQATKADTNGVASYNTTAKTCANVDCHYETTTPTYAAVGWDSGNLGAPDCETCHFYRDGATYPTGAYTIGSLPDAHQVHVAGIPAPSADQSKAYPCSYCHDVGGYTTSHLDGAIDLDVSATPNANADESVVQADVSVKFGVGVAPNDADAVCSGIYCHGADFSGAADGSGGTRGTDITPVWSQHDTGTCGDCHDIDVDGVGSQAFDDGAHRSHVPLSSGGVQYGPNFSNHYYDCAICHGFKDPLAGGFCGMCHNPIVLMPGAPGDAGREWSPSASHVEGAFELDFANRNRGWNTLPGGFGVVGTVAPIASTDICDRCHSTANVGGDVGVTLAKSGWTTATRIPCENCHNGTTAAFSQPVSGGIEAPTKDTYFDSRGHGLAASSTYPWYSGAGRNGAAAACNDCHDDLVGHFDGTTGDTDRLILGGNALCNDCHDGPGGGGTLGNAVSQVSTHANTSTTMTATYSRQRAQFELNCVECHDVHGSTNIFMINDVNADGPLVATRLYGGSADVDPGATKLFNGTVVFTADASGADYAVPAANATKICQTCHTQTGHYQFDGDDGHLVTDCIVCHKHDFEDDYAANSQDGFMPAGCNGCHGFPPVDPADVPLLGIVGVSNCAELDASSSDYRCENYTDGGGPHFRHVAALKAKLGDSVDPIEICGPCHGDGAGTTDHNGSAQGPGTWPISARGFVNIRVRATGNSWDGMPADPISPATYGGDTVNVVGATPPGNGVDAADSRCAGVDCHGNPDDADPDEVLSWNLDVADGGGAEDGLNKSRTCEGCHDQTPSQWRVYDLGGGTAYTGNAPDAATSYYGTPSGYGRGGHGDDTFVDEDPFIDSGTGSTPIDCTACHDDATGHFPADADLGSTGNTHRLVNTTLENTSHSSAGLCNSCHNGGTYPGPGNHHPSLRGTANNANKDIVVNAASQEVRTAVDGTTNWVDAAGGPCGIGDDFCEQDAYGAANFAGNTDFFVDLWGGSPGNGNQSPPPQPNPFAVLPLLQYVGNQSGLSNAVMCVTCHNPHGTDLFVFDPGGVGTLINDNNMLRVRDSDNSLCNACH